MKPANMTQAEWDQLQRELNDRQFTGHAAGPGSWRIAANVLLTAANLLGSQILAANERQTRRTIAGEIRGGPMSPEDTLDMYIGMTGSVWIMLYALALENILKGIIALREGANLYGGTKKTLTAKSHKLVPLAERSGVKLTSEETDLLEELSTYSIWRGKFFIPLSAEELSDFETQLQGKRRLRGRPTEMKEILDALLLKVMTAYTQHREEFDTKEKPDD